MCNTVVGRMSCFNTIEGFDITAFSVICTYLPDVQSTVNALNPWQLGLGNFSLMGISTGNDSHEKAQDIEEKLDYLSENEPALFST
jgi:hypothetical protein